MHRVLCMCVMLMGPMTYKKREDREMKTANIKVDCNAKLDGKVTYQNKSRTRHMKSEIQRFPLKSKKLSIHSVKCERRKSYVKIIMLSRIVPIDNKRYTYKVV